MDDRIKILKQDYYGRGVARFDNKVLFIEGALPLEEVKIKNIICHKKYNVAEVSEFIESSPRRVKASCPYYDICGGCNIMHQAYADQLAFKSQKVQEVIKKFLKDQDIIFNPIVTSGEAFNYRNKIILHSIDGKLGLYQKNSNKLVPINECLISKEPINEIIYLIQEKIIHKELINRLMIRITSLNEAMLAVDGDLNQDELLQITHPLLKSVILNGQTIRGKDCIIEQIKQYKFKISAPTFFQVNTKMIECLYDVALKYLQDKHYHKALDLYCGSGTITLLMSDHVEHVTGIEIVEDAIKDAKYNAHLNNVKNVDFIVGAVEDHLDKLEDLDLIVVDPPRSGLDKKVIENILRMKSQTFIYISCDVITLARDLNLLSTIYQIKEITPVDMFPNTYHVECVALLMLKK